MPSNSLRNLDPFSNSIRPFGGGRFFKEGGSVNNKPRKVMSNNKEFKVTSWKEMPEAKEILAFLHFLNQDKNDEHRVNLPINSQDYFNHINQ